LKEVFDLIKKDFLLEIRQKYALNAILLYVVSTVFVVQLSFGRIIDDTTWIALFWIILLFAAFNAVSKSFIQEHTARRLYYFMIAAPVTVIMSKIIYNSLLMVVLGFLSLGLYILFLGLPELNPVIFYPSFILGCIGLASALTMVSAIASSAGSNAALMAVLGFPVVIPLLLLVINAFKLALQIDPGIQRIAGSLGSLFLIDAVVVILAVVLFPYLWRK